VVTSFFVLYNPSLRRDFWSIYRSAPIFYSPQFQDKDLHRVLSNSFFFTNEEITEIENYILVNIIFPLLFGAPMKYTGEMKTESKNDYIIVEVEILDSMGTNYAIITYKDKNGKDVGKDVYRSALEGVV
jgi:hypothetical protein